jgi:hypothetical protein
MDVKQRLPKGYLDDCIKQAQKMVRGAKTAVDKKNAETILKINKEVRRRLYGD